MALDKLPISIKKKKSLVAHHFLTPERNRRKKGEVVGRGGRVVGAGGRGGGQTEEDGEGQQLAQRKSTGLATSEALPGDS